MGEPGPGGEPGILDKVEFQKLGNWGTFSEQEYMKKDVLNSRNPHHEAAIDTLQRILEKGSRKIDIIQNIL